MNFSKGKGMWARPPVEEVSFAARIRMGGGGVVQRRRVAGGEAEPPQKKDH